MKNSFFKILLVGVLFSVLICWSTNASFAESQQGFIEVTVDSAVEPTSAIGLILSQNETIQVPVKEMTLTTDNKMIISIPYNENDTPRDAMATAMLMSKDGELVFANVRRIFAPEPKDSYLDIPKCAPEKVTEAALEGQTGLVESLVQIRADRRRVAQLAVANEMKGDFLARIQKLESAFGLSNPQPLSPDLPPVVLIDRLSRIIEGIKSFQTAPQQNSAPEKAQP